MKPWDDPSMIGAYSGQACVIIGCGPSYDAVPRDFYSGKVVLALNAALTEFTRHEEHVWWCCHDLFKIFRNDFRAKIKGYDPWRLLTRRVYLPGRAGEVPYRGVGGGEIKTPFPWRIPKADLDRSEIAWYCELPSQENYLRADEGVLEVALAAAKLWGFSETTLVGIDMSAKAGGYARPWRWKQIKIDGAKFARMRRVLASRRGEWPENTRILRPGWPGCPFERLDAS